MATPQLVGAGGANRLPPLILIRVCKSTPPSLDSPGGRGERSLCDLHLCGNPGCVKPRTDDHVMKAGRACDKYQACSPPHRLPVTYEWTMVALTPRLHGGAIGATGRDSEYPNGAASLAGRRAMQEATFTGKVASFLFCPCEGFENPSGTWSSKAQVVSGWSLSRRIGESV